MKIRSSLLVLILASLPAAAQKHKLTAINAETPEGKVLQQIMSESDLAKRSQLMEEFLAQHSGHNGAGWVMSQLQASYLKASNWDKALEIGNKLIAMDKDDLDAAYGNLKASEAKKDADGVVKWAAATSEIAKSQIAAPKPADAEAEEHWKQSIDYAKQVDTYTEYAVYSQAMQNTDPAKLMSLVESLDQRAPESQYLPQVLGRYAGAARQSNQIEKALALGEKTYQRNQVHEDMLLAMAEAYLNRKDPDKAVLYGNKTVEVMSAKPKPEGISDADWEKKKNTTIGVGHWIAGVALAGQNKFAPADKSLRSALPLVQDNDELKSRALFFLGLANYKLGQASKNKAQITDALRFSEQAAAIKGPLQGQAAKNVKVIRTEFGIK